MTWTRQVVKQVEDIGLKKKDKKDASDRPKWHDAVNKLSRIMRRIRPHLLTETKPNLKYWISLSLSLFVAWDET